MRYFRNSRRSKSIGPFQKQPTRTYHRSNTPCRAQRFQQKKDREHDKRPYIQHWREQWANVQNEAYARCGLDIRVNHESLEVQGINRVPTIHLSRIDWRKEQRGERTPAGDRKRAIERENKMRELCQKPHLPYYDLDYTR